MSKPLFQPLTITNIDETKIQKSVDKCLVKTNYKLGNKKLEKSETYMT